MIQFQETGVPGFDGTDVVAGTLPYYRLNQTWNGDYMGRITPDLWNATLMSHDTRPAKISDLAGYLNDGTMVTFPFILVSDLVAPPLDYACQCSQVPHCMERPPYL